LAIIKAGKIYRIILTTVKEAKAAINEYMDFYRIHQSLDYKTP